MGPGGKLKQGRLLTKILKEKISSLSSTPKIIIFSINENTINPTGLQLYHQKMCKNCLNRHVLYWGGSKPT